DTLFKVRKVLGQYICGKQAITDCISELQNAGIYFRERVPEHQFQSNPDDDSECLKCGLGWNLPIHEYEVKND
ncbi:MAG TPA: hypothetical protein VGD31_11535, partial [Sphingobacteriaceae bacterium]